MIPTLEDLLDGFAAGTFSRTEALNWLREHINNNNDGSLRDHFAGQALAGLCASNSLTLAQSVESAWIAADLMLEKRAQQEGRG